MAKLRLRGFVLAVVLPVSIDDGEEVELEEYHSEEHGAEARLNNNAELLTALCNVTGSDVFHSALFLHGVAAHDPGLFLPGAFLHHVEAEDEQDHVGDDIAQEEGLAMVLCVHELHHNEGHGDRKVGSESQRLKTIELAEKTKDA